MDLDKARTVFASVREVNFDREGRDPHHNLTDPLEIAALVVGLKPAFLGGQSPTDEPLLADLAVVAERLGLLVRRDNGLIPVSEFLALKPLPIDPAYLLHYLDLELKNPKPEDQVLWIYVDPAIGEQIIECERGQRSSADVLGYPQCCVDHFLTLRAKRHTLKLDAYRREYGADSTAEIIRIETMGVGPSLAVRRRIEEVDDQIRRELGESIFRFPFIHFTACPACRATPNSPADRLHAQMHDLAYALDESFAKQFEEYAKTYREAHEGYFGSVP